MGEFETRNSEELYKQNHQAVGEILLNSESGRSADYYRNQLFPILTAEQEQELNEGKEKIFNESYKKNTQNIHIN